MGLISLVKDGEEAKNAGELVEDAGTFGRVLSDF